MQQLVPNLDLADVSDRSGAVWNMLEDQDMLEYYLEDIII